MSTIDCETFTRWLDEGAGPGLEAEALDHALGCERCAVALASMAEFDAWMVEPVAAPAGFTDAVLARIERAAHAPVIGEAMPWWVAILQHPAVVLAAAAAALVLWRGHALVAGAASASTWLAHAWSGPGALGAPWLRGLVEGHAGTGANPGLLSVVPLGVALGLAPLLGMASWALADWVAHRASRWGGAT